MKQIPIFSTIVVVAAAGVMVALGIWQLGRAEEKSALIAQSEAALQLDTEVPFPRDENEAQAVLYRRSRVECVKVQSIRTTAARSDQGRSGMAQVALCELAGGSEAKVEAEIMLGWTIRPQIVEWTGGEVSGFIAPAKGGVKLVASPPQAGLTALAKPNPNDLPNNHLAYAGQWFFFALTALLIYGFALRKKQRDS